MRYLFAVSCQQQHNANIHLARVITLTCGRKWHYNCILQQLQTAQPTLTGRLLFTGCQCAKCGTICNYPNLCNFTQTTDNLQECVNKLLQEQLAFDAPELWKQATAHKKQNRIILNILKPPFSIMHDGNMPFICVATVTNPTLVEQSSLPIKCKERSQKLSKNNYVLHVHHNCK